MHMDLVVVVVVVVLVVVVDKQTLVCLHCRCPPRVACHFYMLVLFGLLPAPPCLPKTRLFYAKTPPNFVPKRRPKATTKVSNVPSESL